jgi:hypothetical protein
MFVACGLLSAQERDVNGTINAVAGDVLLNGGAIFASGLHIGASGEISTGRGMVEVLLTPGNFLRIGNRSTVVIAFTSPEQANVRVKSGTAMLESLSSAGTISVDEGGVQSMPHAPGLFEFDQARGVVIVLYGSADLREKEGRVAVTTGCEARAASLKIEPMKPRAADSLYAWASYRSEQLSSESASVQPSDVPTSDAKRPSWVRMPWSDSYTFISPSGYVESPFGWPFYAPGHSHNYIPFPGSGDSYLYGAPMTPRTTPFSLLKGGEISAPTVPLTGPGVPAFRKNR